MGGIEGSKDELRKLEIELRIFKAEIRKLDKKHQELIDLNQEQ